MYSVLAVFPSALDRRFLVGCFVGGLVFVSGFAAGRSSSQVKMNPTMMKMKTGVSENRGP